MRDPYQIAIVCSDLHLTLQQPVCRADKNWMDVQMFYLEQLKALAGNLPVICSGDIFDKWNAPPELINFALEHLPDNMICVPGQHDLPNHRSEDMHRSGYGVLKTADKIIDLSECKRHTPDSQDFVAYGFGWGKEIKPLDSETKLAGTLYVAVVHRYLWLDENSSYPNAPADARYDNNRKAFQTYDAVVIGDNHKYWRMNNCFNCGTFLRRKSDEVEYIPSVGRLYSNGKIQRVLLSTTKDRFHPKPKEREEKAFNMRDFINSLEDLGEQGLDFQEAIQKHLRGEEIDKETREIINRALKSE